MVTRRNLDMLSDDMFLKVTFSVYRYRHYPRLGDALAALSRTNNGFIVSSEFDYSGKRAFFLMNSPQLFFRYLKKKKTESFQRNYPSFYEVITEQRRVKVYLDVEWKKGANNSLYPNFRQCFEDYITNLYNGPTQFFWTCASQDAKESYHLVVGGFSLRTKSDVKAIVNNFIQSLPPNVLSQFIVEGKSIIDTNVYCQGNQQFRLPYSTKWVSFRDQRNGRRQRPFLPMAAIDENSIKHYLAQVLPCEIENHPLWGLDNIQNSFEPRSSLLPYREIRAIDPTTVLPPNLLKNIDSYVNPGNVIKCSNREPNKYRVFTTGRFCVIKEDYHKSNTVFFDVDLDRHTLFQGCHDVVCSGIYYGGGYVRPNLWSSHPLLMTDDDATSFLSATFDDDGSSVGS